MTIVSALVAAALAVAAQVPQPQPVQTPPPSGQPATLPPQGQQTPPRPGFLPAQTPRPPQGRESLFASLQGFNIVLLVGESQSSGASIEDVPAAARKALADMRDFLPFKHYRVLDSQWTSCCSNTSSSRLSGRLQGVMAAGGSDGSRLLPRTYSFSLSVFADSRLNVHFVMTSDPVQGRGATPSAFSPAREAELEKRLSDLRREMDTLEDDLRRQENKSNTSTLNTLQAQHTAVQRRIVEVTNELETARVHVSVNVDRGRSSLIDGSFTMDVGETVVVGTSRLGGDKALIAIVTAARRGGR
jgi:hypothetical protein